MKQVPDPRRPIVAEQKRGESFIEATSFILDDVAVGARVAARDSLGATCVYFRDMGAQRRFAFEISDLFDTGERPAIDPDGLIQFLTFQFCPAPWTLVQGVGKLAPGETLRVGYKGRITSETKPLIAYQGASASGDPQPVLDEIYDHLATAVDAEGVDVLCSGGVDSTINVLHLATRTKVSLLTAAFDDPAFDESPYARIVAHSVDAPHELVGIHVPPLSALACLAGSLAEPIADRALVPTNQLLSRPSGTGRTVVSGEGGDELWGPPRRYDLGLEDFPPTTEFSVRYLTAISCTTPEERVRLTGRRDSVFEGERRAADRLFQVATDAGVRNAFEAARAIQTAGWFSENVLQKDLAVGRHTGRQVSFPLANAAAAQWLSGLAPGMLRTVCEDKSALRAVIATAGLSGAIDRPKHKFKTPRHLWRLEACRSWVITSAQTPGRALYGLICPNGLIAGGLLDERIIFGLFVLDTWFDALVRRTTRTAKDTTNTLLPGRF